jgi:hypothetical protein
LIPDESLIAWGVPTAALAKMLNEINGLCEIGVCNDQMFMASKYIFFRRSKTATSENLQQIQHLARNAEPITFVFCLAGF